MHCSLPGRRIVYVADQDADEIVELYGNTSDGSDNEFELFVFVASQ